MKLSFLGLIGVAILSAIVAGGCAAGNMSGACSLAETHQWAANPKLPDFMASGPEGLGTVRVRLIAADPRAVTYWRESGTATAKEVIAYLGLVEVGKTAFQPGETGFLEIKLPPGKYWLRLAGNSLTVKADAAGVEKTIRIPDRETTLPVEVGRRTTTTVNVDYSSMGYPFFAAI